MVAVPRGTPVFLMAGKVHACIRTQGLTQARLYYPALPWHTCTVCQIWGAENPRLKKRQKIWNKHRLWPFEYWRFQLDFSPNLQTWGVQRWAQGWTDRCNRHGLKIWRKVLLESASFRTWKQTKKTYTFQVWVYTLTSALYSCPSCLYKHAWVVAYTSSAMVKGRVQGRVNMLANELVNLQLQLAELLAT